jgi:F0F1-type ATP synthase membrane subunit b/b'
MRSWIAYSFLALSFNSLALAAGQADGGHGSPKDLIAPAVNVFILFAVLIWKLKKPLSQHFDTKSQEVAHTLERANLKSQEAQMMLEMEANKLAHLEQDLKKIQQQAEADILVFEKNVSREVEEKTHKLKIDANSKIQADKKSIMDELNIQLLDQVLNKTKSTIKTNKDYQTKVTTKLLQGL